MKKPKMFVVRKYIMAHTAAEAIRKDKKEPVHDVWVDDDWKKGAAAQLAEAIGFTCTPPKDEDDE